MSKARFIRAPYQGFFRRKKLANRGAKYNFYVTSPRARSPKVFWILKFAER